MKEPRTIRVLLIEDNPGDVRLVREGLAGWQSPATLDVIVDGLEASRFLRGEPPYDSAPRPDLVILDLKLPRVDGSALLQEMRERPDFHLPVVVFSSSSNDIERLQSRASSPDLYLVKPIRLDEYLEAVRSIERYWREWGATEGKRTRPA